MVIRGFVKEDYGDMTAAEIVADNKRRDLAATKAVASGVEETVA